MTEVITKTDVTATGFSKKSFGCCARHHLCEMGKKGCFYEEIDKEVPLLCAAFQRNNQLTMTAPEEIMIQTESFNSDAQLNVLEVESNTNENNEETFYEESDNGQLSLF